VVEVYLQCEASGSGVPPQGYPGGVYLCVGGEELKLEAYHSLATKITSL
jgi:hypothetical protein